MKITEEVSLRGVLIKAIVNDFCIRQLFTHFEDITEQLQNELNSHLKFETKISNLYQTDSLSSGDIYFVNENGVDSMINFHVLNTNTVF